MSRRLFFARRPLRAGALRSGLALLMVLAGCGGPRVAGTAPDGESASLDLWTGIGGSSTDASSTSPAGCQDAFGAYAWGFGVRALACTADATRSLAGVAARSGLPVFVSGPHAPGPAGLGLDLASRDFGHYNPTFVRWGVENGVVGEGRPAVQAATQAAYDVHLRRLARVYWLVHGDLVEGGFPERIPPGPTKDYVRYLQGGPLGAGADDVYPGFTMTAFGDRTRTVPAVLGIAADDLDWYEAQYEANTAVGFWLRRREDATHGEFRDGLERLLTVYDAAWLDAHPG